MTQGKHFDGDGSLSGSESFQKIFYHYTYRVRNLKFARSLKFATSKTLVNLIKTMMFLSKN